ncbi:MAG TPA: hypothetical protein VN723_08950 [Rhizomicrobium sp.]|jgi:hypothetical protein|nr:hypothetical protein [Rhizomicrobium sp.]
MPMRTLNLLTSALVSAAIIASPLAAQAGGVSHPGTYGGISKPAPVSTCGPGPSHPSRPVTINNNINVYKRTTIDNNINVYKPVTINKTIDNSKNVDITNNIDNSKNIDITKNIDNSKTIDNSKNISINKSIVINKNNNNNISVSAEASASAVANAAAFGAGVGAAAVVVGGGGFAPEAPQAFIGGELGTLSVAAAPQQCTIEEATIVKSIHAVCVTIDQHEFPASHMTGDTWISASYEGEVARCIPGAHLKINIGKVVQSNQGLAAGISKGEMLECGPHEALRHFKDGMLKCAPAVAVPDCTERTNLRKYGSADMFFSYRAQVCLETHEEYSDRMASVGR